MANFYSENLGDMLNNIEKLDVFIKGLFAEKFLFEKVLILNLLKTGELEFIYDDDDLTSIDGFNIEYEMTAGNKLRIKLTFPEKGIVQ